MSNVAVSNISSQALGNFLQIYFTDGIRNQLSEDYRDWEFIQRNRVSDPNGRSQRFSFQSSYGPAAVQWSAVATPGNYPSAQKGTYSEYEAVYKELSATIELEYNLWNRARKSPAKYADPLASEIQSKSIAAKRRLSADLYLDGTGILGEVSGTPVTGSGTGLVVITLQSGNDDRGHIGAFEYGDIIFFADNDSTAAVATTGGSHAYWTLEDKSRANNTITVMSRTSAGAANTSLSASGLVDGDLIYRGTWDGSSTASATELIDDASSIADYNTASEAFAGLESLTQDDSRVVHGITMSGANGGSRYDCGGDPFDTSHIQKGMSQTKTAVGEGRYRYKSMLMAPEANDVLIESRETDRRFQTMDDAKRGTKMFGYQHGNDFLEVVTSEFCPKKRVYMLPEAKNGKKVLEFWGSDFEVVKPGGSGSEFMLKPATSTHARAIRSYLESMACLISKHSKAICVLENFVLS